MLSRAQGLVRIHGGGNLHFITSSCYRRVRLFASAHSREVFLEIFERVRRRYDFLVIGFVVMPEHIHLLISEPTWKTVAVVMQVLKKRVADRLLPKRKPSRQRELWASALRRHFWQPRYYDFNVYSDRKVTEKLRYMHWNPVRRGLVAAPELWRWSSYRTFANPKEGIVKLNWQVQLTNTESLKPNKGAADILLAHPPKTAEDGAPTFSFGQRKPKTHDAR